MSASNLVIDQYNTECEYNAQYTNIMYHSTDDLNNEEMLISSNCKYILIRNPSNYLSFYSIEEAHLIQKWDISNNSIWDIQDSDFADAEQIQMTNVGCLSFTDANDTTFSEICNTETYSVPYITNATISRINIFSLQGTNAMDKIENNLIIIVPVILCFIGIFGVIAFLYHRCQKRKYASVDRNGGRSPISISSLETVLDMRESESDNEEQLMCADNLFIDLSDCLPPSSSIFYETSKDDQERMVLQKIVSVFPAMTMSRSESSDECYGHTENGTGLTVPTVLLKNSVFGGSGSSASSASDSEMSDLDMNIGLINTRVHYKLSVIKDEIDVECLREVVNDEEDNILP